MSNRTQAVRLPKSVALPESVRKVDIIKVGRTRAFARVDSRNEQLAQIYARHRSSRGELDPMGRPISTNVMACHFLFTVEMGSEYI